MDKTEDLQKDVKEIEKDESNINNETENKSSKKSTSKTQTKKSSGKHSATKTTKKKTSKSNNSKRKDTDEKQDDLENESNSDNLVAQIENVVEELKREDVDKENVNGNNETTDKENDDKETTDKEDVDKETDDTENDNEKIVDKEDNKQEDQIKTDNEENDEIKENTNENNDEINTEENEEKSSQIEKTDVTNTETEDEKNKLIDPDVLKIDELEKIKNEIKENKRSKRFSDEKQKKYREILKNILLGILINIYLLFLLLGKKSMGVIEYINDLKVFILIEALISILLLEIAYYKKNKKLIIHSIEMLGLGTITVLILDLLNRQSEKLNIAFAVITGVFTLYYLIKIIVIAILKTEKNENGNI